VMIGKWRGAEGTSVIITRSTREGSRGVAMPSKGEVVSCQEQQVHVVNHEEYNLKEKEQRQCGGRQEPQVRRVSTSSSCTAVSRYGRRRVGEGGRSRK